MRQALTQLVGEIVVTLEYLNDVIQHAKIDRQLCRNLFQDVCAVLGRNLKTSGILL